MLGFRTSRKKISPKRKITVGFAFFGVMLCLYTSVPVHAVTQNRLKTYLDGGGSSWYDSDFCTGGVVDSVATATGPAATQMQKAGLDGKWVDLIIKYAKQYKTDPIAMAALLFWENRKFPAYDANHYDINPGRGSGPWQFTQGSWNAKKYGAYAANVVKPVPSTEAAAELVKAYGGNAGSPAGHIAQNFAKSTNTPSMATVAKNYNAGQATWREPGVAKWNQQGRAWNQPAGNWGGTKERIIDDYVVGMTYLYYQIASGQKITFKDTNSYVDEALKKQDTIKNFVFKDTGAPDTSEGTVSTQTPATGENPVIVLDPGHSGKDRDEKDPQSGLRDHDYPNIPEIDDMWDVSKLVERELISAGYSVKLTKKNARDTVSLRERANIANQNKAALAISLHDQAGANGGLKFGKWSEIYPQKLYDKDLTEGDPKQGSYRKTENGNKKLTFDNKAVADKSMQYANDFKETRAKTEGITPTIKLNNFNDRDGLDPGNTPLVQMFSNVPWVYMEAGGNSGGGVGLSEGDKKKYADGIIEGVKKAIKAGTPGVSGDSCAGDITAGGGGVAAIADMAVKLSWPEPWSGPKGDRSAINDPKAEYVQAAKTFNKSSGETIIDCGRFVATVMHASGADKDYPVVYTPNQRKYVRDHPEKYQVFEGKNAITDPADLRPGDILIVGEGGTAGHTYLFIGEQPVKGKFDSAGASLGVTRPGKAPHLHKAYLSDSRGQYLVARLKQ